MNRPSDDRSPIAIAFSWASQATAIGIEMALPGLIGYWLDKKFDTGVVFTLSGVGIGLTAGFWHLIQLTRAMNPDDADGNGDEADGGEHESDG